MNAAPSSTRVVVLTPPGRSAIATVLVEGPAALAIVGAIFQSASYVSLADQPLDRVLFGQWPSTSASEELVVARRGTERIEIHCHGGHAAVDAIVQSLVDRGCLAVDWRDWVASFEADPIAAAARTALAAAPTERTAAVLWDQYRGALRGEIESLGECLQRGDTAAALTILDALLTFAPLGRHLTTPWQIVLVGRPNTGKSSLTNALLGYERAIVHETPGTTRDLVHAPAAFDGWPVQLIDTAGMRATDDPLEAAGIELAEARQATADLVILVSDASAPWTAEDARLLATVADGILVHSKSDLITDIAATLAGRPAGLVCSAVAAGGTALLEQAIVERLAPSGLKSGQAVPFSDAQIECLESIRRSLRDSRPHEAPGVARSLVKTLAAGPFGRSYRASG